MWGEWVILPPMSKQKVLLGMSGGVDSSVSAALLIEQGYEVIGAFMKNWSDCEWRADKRDAARVAAKLDIPFVTFDFEDEYREKVVENLFEESQAGRTPNPDVLCNKYIKFDRFMQEADRLGCQYVATGHYAQTQDGKLLAGLDKNKDQTYFLWAMPPDALPRVLFPIGDMEKPDVRAKALKLGLDVATKKDSTGICFVGEVDMKAFLQERLPKDPGNVVTIDGDVIGTHEGLAFYTIGQRHGLNIGGGEPWYVVEKRGETKEVVVASNFHPALFKPGLTARQLNWFDEPEMFPYPCKARIRYRQALQDCVIESNQDGVVAVSFKEPQRAVTPGQSIVFYQGEEVLGGGIID